VKGVEIPGVPCRETASFFFVPGEEMRVLDEMGSFLEQRADTNVILDLDVAGWVESLSEDACAAEVELMVRKYRDHWRAVNTGTLQITGIAELPGGCPAVFAVLEGIGTPGLPCPGGLQ